MKIEMCESLFYSWLRHVKGCQLVQTNWKPSPTWTIENRVKAEKFMQRADEYFKKKHGYEIFKSNSFSQLISQAESDLLGISFTNEITQAISVETAFHEGGLNYGGTEETITRIIKKLARCALCAAGYFNVSRGEIIFASPKIHNAVLSDLKACVEELNNLFRENGFDFTTRVIANEDFKNEVLLPVLEVSNRVSDTTELFMRSWQLMKMFENIQHVKKPSEVQYSDNAEAHVRNDIYGGYKIGQLARMVFGPMLESGAASEEEITLLQEAYYSKETLHLNYPALVAADSNYDPARYYSNSLFIRGKLYKMCNDWYETSANNDRPSLLMWIETHKEAK